MEGERRGVRWCRWWWRAAMHVWEGEVGGKEAEVGANAQIAKREFHSTCSRPLTGSEGATATHMPGARGPASICIVSEWVVAPCCRPPPAWPGREGAMRPIPAGARPTIKPSCCTRACCHGPATRTQSVSTKSREGPRVRARVASPSPSPPRAPRAARVHVRESAPDLTGLFTPHMLSRPSLFDCGTLHSFLAWVILASSTIIPNLGGWGAQVSACL